MPYDALVADVDLELRLSHTAPDDLDLLLVGPGGLQALVMADAGSSLDVEHLRFAIDDEGATQLPDAAPITDTRYQPANYAGPDTFPAPAPDLVGNTSLSVFDGHSAAGVWRLYAMDDAPLDTGAIDAWGLRIRLQPTPNPGTLDVAGLPPVTDVNVTLHGFSSTYPADMDVLLVAPGGQQATLMSDAGEGGSADNDVHDLTLTLDDEGLGPLADEAALRSGVFRPTDYAHGLPDTYPGDAPSPNSNTSLAAFDGLSPNGRWRLYFIDDELSDVSTITGWSLQLSFADTQSPTGSINIAGGQATASGRAVTLALSASDPAPSGGVTQMRFSNDGTTFSPYQPYATTAAWELSDGDGAKTVFAQFRDADGNESAIAADTITLATGTGAGAPADTTAPRAMKVSPAAGAKTVKLSAKVLAKATEALEAGSITGKTAFLTAEGSSRHLRAKLAYRPSSHTIVLTPTGRLRHRTTYRVVIQGVRDLAGNAWDQKPAQAGAQPLRYAFTTS